MKFAWAFDEAKHTGDVLSNPELEFNPDEILWLSFDFNVNPMTCIAAQKTHKGLNVIRCFKLENSNTYQMCDRIMAEFPGAMFKVTGDASGASLNAAMQDQMHNYAIIQEKLMLNIRQLEVPQSNPRIEANQILVNAVLLNVPVCIDKMYCQPLIFDLNYVEIGKDKKILKDRTTEEKKSDFLDCFRYLVNVNYSIEEIKHLSYAKTEEG